MRPEERAEAVSKLRAILTDQGDAEPMETLYDLRTTGSKLFAVPRDIDADFHLAWDGLDWQLLSGPMATAAAHWWRTVRIVGRRYGVSAPMTCTEAALNAWGEGMSSGWYAREHLERDLGIPEDEWRIPTIKQTCTVKAKCDLHHEPLLESVGGCPVSGCEVQL